VVWRHKDSVGSLGVGVCRRESGWLPRGGPEGGMGGEERRRCCGHLANWMAVAVVSGVLELRMGEYCCRYFSNSGSSCARA